MFDSENSNIDVIENEFSDSATASNFRKLAARRQ